MQNLLFFCAPLSLSPLHPHRTIWDSLHMSCPSRPVCPCSGFSWKVHPFSLGILSSSSLSQPQLKPYFLFEAFPKWVAPCSLLWRPLFASFLQLLDALFVAYSSLHIFLSHAADCVLLKDSGLLLVFSDVLNSGDSMSPLLNKQMDAWLLLKLMILTWALMSKLVSLSDGKTETIRVLLPASTQERWQCWMAPGMQMWGILTLCWC